MAAAAIPVTKGIFKVSNKDTNHEKWAAMWHATIAVGGQIAFVIALHSLTKYLIRRTTDRLSVTLRSQTFRTLIKQPIQFFDSKSNSIGSLVGMLSSDIRHLNGASFEIYFLVVHGMSGAIAAIVVAYVY